MKGKKWRCAKKMAIVLMFVLQMLLANTITADAASNPYPEWQTIGGITNRRCTWYAWKMAYERTGVALPGLGNGGEWYDNARNHGYSVGTTAVANCIAVWTDSGFGHVGFVESVSNGRMHVLEGGRTDIAGGIGTINLSATVGTKRNDNTQTLKGFIYLNHSGKWYDSMTPVNEGDTFYANLIKCEGWAHVGSPEGSNVEISSDNTIFWYFVRQPDGSYVIYNCSSGKALDVQGGSTESGGNVHLWGYAGLDNQKWYIYGRWNGEYYLRPKNSDKVLDVSNNGNAIGTNVQIWDKNDTAAQRFSIYKHPKAGSSVLTVSAGDSNTFSTLSWTAASDTTSYNVRITMKNESTGEYAPYRDFWKETGTSCSTVLPAGNYRAYVDSCNSYSYTASNVVDFTVRQGAGAVRPPETEPSTEPGAEPETEPSAEPGTEPDSKPGTKPESGADKESESETAKKPSGTASRPGKAEQKPGTSVKKPSSSKPSYSEPVRKLAKCKIKSLKSRKKKATLKWGKVKDAYWYEVCFSTKRNAGGKKRTVYGTSFTTPKLKKGKVYYFKVRAYGYPGNGSTSAYSAWSAVKKVRIK